MRLPAWIGPRNLVGQLLLATGLALAVAQSVNFALLMHGRNEQRDGRIMAMAANRISDINERILAGQPPVPARARWRSHIRLIDSKVAPPVDGTAMHSARNLLARELAELGLPSADVRVIKTVLSAAPPIDPANTRHRHPATRGPVSTIVITARLVDGRWARIDVAAPRLDPRLAATLALQTLLIYLAVLFPIAWIGTRAARPLRRLTAAARNGEVRSGVGRLPEDGPHDVRALTRAFNDLRERIAAMLTEKDRMLGALGHDLRTPLASLRLRVEQIGDDALRSKLVRTLDEMAAMIEDILALARLRHEVSSAAPTDLAALVDALIEDYRDMGHEVVGEGTDIPAVRSVHTVSLRRALRNLIDNALHYGGAADVRLGRAADAILIEIGDRGPGIAAADIPAMLEPFTRADSSRNRRTGGSGLGLALAKALVEQDGGTLELANRDGGGLIAAIRLPFG